MFVVNARIVSDIERLKKISVEEFDSDKVDIEGFFQLIFNDNKQGYYHCNKLRYGEEGEELITLNFKLLIDVAMKLKKNQYVAVGLIENNCVWLEFTRKGDILVVNKAELKEIYSSLCLGSIEEDRGYFIYPYWRDVEISYKEFIDEISKKVILYLDEIAQINSRLLNSEIIVSLKRKFDLFSKELVI